MLTKVIATGIGAIVAGVAAYQVTSTVMNGSCSATGSDTALVSTEGGSCCPLKGDSTDAAVLTVAETGAACSMAEVCATSEACTPADCEKAPCDPAACATDEAVVLNASLETGESCSAEKAACSTAEKVACGGDAQSNPGGVEILMVAGEAGAACSTGEKAACDTEKKACDTKAECETEKLAAAATAADNS